MQHQRIVNSASFSPDGSRVVTASYDNTARLWDASTGALVGVVARNNKDQRSAEFFPDGRKLLLVFNWTDQSKADAGDVQAQKTSAVPRYRGEAIVWQLPAEPDPPVSYLPTLPAASSPAATLAALTIAAIALSVALPLWAAYRLRRRVALHQPLKFTAR
jgi:hypothetical protein